MSDVRQVTDQDCITPDDHTNRERFRILRKIKIMCALRPWNALLSKPPSWIG